MASISFDNYGIVADANLVDVFDGNGKYLYQKATGTDVTDKMNKYLADCRDAGFKAVIPSGRYLIAKNLIIQCPTEFHGTLVVPNNTNDHITIKGLDSDIQSIDIAEVKLWTNCVRDSAVIGGLNNKSGYYVLCNVAVQDQALYDRKGEGVLALKEGFLVTDNSGRIAHPLYFDWKNTGWGNHKNSEGKSVSVAVAKRVRDNLEVTGLSVVVSNDSPSILPNWEPNHAYAAGETVTLGDARLVSASNRTSRGAFDGEEAKKWNHRSASYIVRVERPNTIISNCSVVNKSAIQISQIHLAWECCGVTYDNCYVEGALYWDTNYGFNSGGCCDITYKDVRQVACRRGIDAHQSKYIRIIGGTLADGWGAHWAWHMGSTDTIISAGTAQNPQCVQVAGGHFYVRGGQMNVEKSAYAAVALREDLYEVYGQLIVENCQINFGDDTSGRRIGNDPAKPLDLYGYVIDARGPKGSNFDPGRDIYLPSLVVLKNSPIKVVEANENPSRFISVIDWMQSGFSNSSSSFGNSKIVNEGRWIVENSPVEFYKGKDKASGLDKDGKPRTGIYYGRSAVVTGSGIDAEISGVNSLMVTVHSQELGESIRSNSRLSAKIAHISGPVVIRRAAGAYKSIVLDSSNFSVQTLEDNTAIGDEWIAFQSLDRVSFEDASYNGSSVVVRPIGPGADLDVWVEPKGNGLTRWGNRTGVSGGTINGYILHKLRNGTTVKIPLIA